MLSRASHIGTTVYNCPAVSSPIPEPSAFFARWRGRPTLSRQFQWCDKDYLQHRASWRDKTVLSRHLLAEPRTACIFGPIARQWCDRMSLSCQFNWRHKACLQRQVEWRDKAVVSCHLLAEPRTAWIFGTMACHWRDRPSLSRQFHWHDRACLQRHLAWRDKGRQQNADSTLLGLPLLQLLEWNLLQLLESDSTSHSS